MNVNISQKRRQLPAWLNQKQSPKKLLSKKTIPQLKEYAKQKGVRVPSAITKKDDIIEHILLAGASVSSSDSDMSSHSSFINRIRKQIDELNELKQIEDQIDYTFEELKDILRNASIPIPKGGITKIGMMKLYIDKCHSSHSSSKKSSPKSSDSQKTIVI